MNVVPTPRLALVAMGASLLAWALPGSGWRGLLVLNVVLLALGLADALVGPSPPTLGVERDLPTAVTLGTRADIAWTIRNPTSRSIRVALSDELAPSLRASTRRISGRVPGRGVMRGTATLHPARRGTFAPQRVTLRVDGPLGLGSRQATLVVPGELRVFPSFRSKDDAELRIRRARLLEVGLRSAPGRRGGTEFEQLRDYSIDDEFRRVDWAATARTGKAIVRTYRAERNQTLVVLLDNGRVMAGRVDGVPRVEHAMDAVMALTTLATGLGDRCGLVAFDRGVRAAVPPGRGRPQLAHMVRALHDLEPALVESDYAGAFTETLARFRRRTMLVLLTDLAQQAATEWLLPALPIIMPEHLVVVGGVSDPDILRWASPGSVEDSSSAYRRAAAIAALAERQRAAARLRRMGAIVIDARPGRLASQLSDAYLEIKATGRL